jgi:hypothetical protein
VDVAGLKNPHVLVEVELKKDNPVENVVLIRSTLTTRGKETRKTQPTSNAVKLLLLLQRTSLLMRSLLVGFTLIV